MPEEKEDKEDKEDERVSHTSSSHTTLSSSSPVFKPSVLLPRPFLPCNLYTETRLGNKKFCTIPDRNVRVCTKHCKNISSHFLRSSMSFRSSLFKLLGPCSPPCQSNQSNQSSQRKINISIVSKKTKKTLVLILFAVAFNNNTPHVKRPARINGNTVVPVFS